MASLDVDSPFTNAPLDVTIKICIDELLKSEMTVCGLNKKEMFEMLSLTLKESIILFDNKYYSQIDGVVMGSPLGLTKDIWIIFLFCLINQNMHNVFLNI